MIWESVTIMTIVDLVVLGLVGAITRITFRQWKLLYGRAAFRSLLIILAGLAVLGVFHLSDLWMMHIQPRLSSPASAREAMTELHLNWYWLAVIAAVSSMCIGFNGLVREHAHIVGRLQTSNDRFEQIAQSIDEIFWLADVRLPGEFELLYVSPRFENMWHMPGDRLYQDPLSWLECVHPSDQKRVLAVMTKLVRGISIRDLEFQIVRPDGSVRTVALSGHQIQDLNDGTIRLAGIIRDITEQNQAEREKKKLLHRLVQKQRLESIGTLAAGVAHEINNPVTGIMNYAQLIDERLDPSSPLREFASAIVEETERIAGITSNLLVFSRKHGEAQSLAEITDIVGAVLSLISAIIKKDQITLEMDLPDDLPKLRCRSQQIQQVLINLLTNARDALNTRYPEYDEDKIMKLSVIPSEKFGERTVRFAVEDHGLGVDNENRNHLFDPFFTTKEGSKGTGLGLSISLGIIQEHGGELYLASEPGQRTRFEFELPVDAGSTSGKT